MPAASKSVIALFVDKATHQWIVRDSDGNFWRLPPSDNLWDMRQPFTPAEETDLEPIPGHYKQMLGVPD